MSRALKEKVKDQVEKLEDNEQLQVFQIVRKYTSQYTRTDTGVFVSMDSLPSECVAEIETYIRFCADQKKQNEEHAKLRKTYEKLINS